MTTKATENPFKAVPDEDENGGPDVLDDVTTLGEAAASAFGENLEQLGAQDTLEGTDYLKVKFLGMSMDSLDDQINLGDEVTFVVRARCIGNGTDISKTDGHEKRYVKMDVQSVVVKDS